MGHAAAEPPGEPGGGALVRVLGAADTVGGADKQVVVLCTPASAALYLHGAQEQHEALGRDKARRARETKAAR